MCFIARQFSLIAVVCALAAVAAAAGDSSCVAPGTCQPPAASYTAGRDVVPRKQWGDNGGYCGSLSIQAIALTYGAYISQDLIRKAAPDGGGHGDPDNGYEILHTNIEAALNTLGFTYQSWDWENAPKPQGSDYLSWLKKQLLTDSAVVQFVICKGDAHNSYGPVYAPIVYDHIEPFYKLYTNHSLADTSVHADDVVSHGSDYAPDGDDNLGYFRAFSTLLDGTEMDTNCKNAQAGYGVNEMYPCIYYDTVYGYSMTGLQNPATASTDIEASNNTATTTTTSSDQKQQQQLKLLHEQRLPVLLSVNSTSEPDIIKGETPALFQGHVFISGLSSGTEYVLYRWNDIYAYPRQSPFALSKFDYRTIFTATGTEYDLLDENLFASDSSVIYGCTEL